MSSLGQTRVLELSDSDATVTCARYAQHGVKILSARLQAWQVADPREWTEAARWATGRPCVTHILFVFADDLALVKDVFVCKGGIAHPHLLASQHCGRHPRDAQEAFVLGKLVAGPPFPTPVKSSSLKRPSGWIDGARMRLRRCRTDAHRLAQVFSHPLVVTHRKQVVLACLEPSFAFCVGDLCGGGLRLAVRALKRTNTELN